MKACFRDFLSLRAGGTGFVFNFLSERPFHSLSYPDINYTIMRPAALPPAAAAVATRRIRGSSVTRRTRPVTSSFPPATR